MTVGLIIQAAVGTASASAQQPEVAAENSVYTVVSSGGSAVGIATLINSRKGIFLTASHVVSSANTMLIKRGDIEVKFQVLLRGNNIAKSVEDWAILQADEDAWRAHTLRAPLNLIYDLPDGSDLGSAIVLSGPDRSSTFAASKINQSQNGVEPCSVDSVILAQTARYDKGFSGASVFVRAAKKGILAITSRFETDGDPQDSETIQLFAKVSKDIEEERGSDGPINSNVLREILKDKIYIKMVPVKCIIDQIIAQDTSRTKIFTTEDSRELDDIQQSISQFMPENLPEKDRQTKLIEITNALGRLNISVIGVMQVLDRYVATFKDSRDPLDIVKLLLFASITENSQRIYAYHLPAAYVRATNTVAHDGPIPPLIPYIQPTAVPSSVDSNGGNLLETFVKKNAQWAYEAGVERVRFDISSLPKSALSASQSIEVGNRLSYLLDNQELRRQMTPETKSLLEKSAVIYLANGLNDAPIYQKTDLMIVQNADTLTAMSNLGNVLFLAQGITAAEIIDPTGGTSIAERLVTAGKSQFAGANYDQYPSWPPVMPSSPPYGYDTPMAGNGPGYSAGPNPYRAIPSLNLDAPRPGVPSWGMGCVPRGMRCD
ncbi:trypsin-like peptidase domain-containing protein [Rhizobium laguerreae]|uniref:hypothetical protein n=1 Tax=Rhizobium laguerreae TaxID=1076926 RepID=UPI001C92AC33|nr:hypothetical protein [Rhizobium laguerreae]MBY3474086.1 trypsin-like peptidase domain-containing protein [Rhizobium laguerreae]MBY3521880.1 trypsin-like peptidase domain-containing protein [Rhizobium laguerreae]